MNTNSLEVYNKINNVLEKLYFCTEKKQIDLIFNDAGITDFQEKINLLRKCMEVEAVYGTPEKENAEGEYEFECAVFEGTWRMLN